MKAMELEHDPRLARILMTRRMLLSIQGAFIGLFTFYILILNGLLLAPLFVPLYNAVLLGALVLLIVSVERIFFFRLCIVYGKRDSAKFLISRKRFRSSLVMIAISVLISAGLVVLTFTPLLNQSGSESGQIGTIEFQSNNVFALNTVGTVTLTNLGINNLTFFIVSANDYYATGASAQHANESALLQLSLNQGNDFVSPGGSTTVSILTNLNTQYFIVIFPSAGSVNVNFVLGMKSMPSLFYAMLMTFAAIPVSGYLAGYARIQMKVLRPATIFA